MVEGSAGFPLSSVMIGIGVLFVLKQPNRLGGGSETHICYRVYDGYMAVLSTWLKRLIGIFEPLCPESGVSPVGAKVCEGLAIIELIIPVIPG